MSYKKNYENWQNNPISFWQEKAKDISWYKKPKKILDSSDAPFWTWFPDGELNTSYNCLDIHIKNGNGDRKALIYDSPVTQTKKTYTYKELLKQPISELEKQDDPTIVYFVNLYNSIF